MKLTKVLWPEIFKNTRGPEKIREMYQYFLKHITFEPGGIQILVDSDAMQMLKDDDNTCSSFALGLRHLKEKAPTYHICADFCQALMQIPDREIPLQYLPESFLGYISFPHGMLRDTAETISGAYVYLGVLDQRTTVTPAFYGQRAIWIGYFGEVPDSIQGRMPGIGRMMYRLDKEQTVQDLQAQYTSEDYNMTVQGKEHLPVPEKEREFRRDLTRLILNTILYLNSQDPVVQRLQPAFGRTPTQARKHATENQAGHLNLCTIPVFAINWDYKKLDRTHLVEGKAFVDTFQRWQRCGVKLSKIKLIWVTEHTRTVWSHREKEENV